MSSNFLVQEAAGQFEPEHIVNVVDTRLTFDDPKHVVGTANTGALFTNFMQLPDNGHSNQATSFNLNQQSDLNIRDRRIQIYNPNVTLTLNITNNGASAAAPIGPDNLFTKQYGYNMALNSVQHRIGQASITFNSNQILYAVNKLKLSSDDANYYDNSCPDIIDSYANASGATINPGQSYTSSFAGDGSFKPRSLNMTSISGNSIAAGATGNVVCTFSFLEPLIDPMNNISSCDLPGLAGVNGETIYLQYLQNSAAFTNMFGYYNAPNMVLNSATVDLGQTCYLNLVYLTPHDREANNIPYESISMCPLYDPTIQDVAGSIAPGATVALRSPVINCTNVPQLIIVSPQMLQSDYNTNMQPQKFLSFDNVSAIFDNANPALAGAVPDALYDITHRNGMTCIPRDCWLQKKLNVAEESAGATALYGSGGPLVLSPAIDFPLRSGVTTSTPGKYTFQITGTLRNRTNTTLPGYTLVIICVYNQVLHRRGRTYQLELVNVPSSKYNMASKLPQLDMELVRRARVSNMFLSGGNFSDFFKKAANKIGSVAKSLYKNKDAIVKAVDAGKDIYEAGKDVYDSVKGGKKNERLKKKLDIFYSN